MGWMERAETDRSQQFDITAVRQHSKPVGDYRALTTAVVDVDNKEIIWIDSPDMMAFRGSNSIDVVNSMTLLMQRYGKGNRMSMGELAEAVAEYSGSEIVQDPKKAKTIFSVDHYEEKSDEQRVITAKEQDIWLGEFMSPARPDAEREPEEKEREKI